MEKVKMLNTVIEFEFCNGTTTNLTLQFYRLYQLKSKKPQLYATYHKAMSSNANGNYDEIDMIQILYVAYVCANMDKEEELLTFEEFMMLCGSDRKAMGNTVSMLINPKKTTDSEKPSEQKQEENKVE